jgi:hypothetical protein
METRKTLISQIRDRETASKVDIPQGKVAAYQRFKRELTRKEKLAIIEEIVETRGATLTRAYKSVVEVSLGHRRRVSRKDGKTRESTELCVVFTVKRKWRKDTDGPSDEKLPAHLFAYWTVGTERKLCAVPTDVVDAREDHGIQPQAKRLRVKVDPKGLGSWEMGTITCAIHRLNSIESPEKLYALSCRHVYSLAGSIPGGVSNTGVFLHDSDAVSRRQVAKTRATAGPFRPARMLPNGSFGDISFDAQLAEVTDIQNLAATLHNIRFSGIADSVFDLPERNYRIRTGRGVDIDATLLLSKKFYQLPFKNLTIVLPRVYLLRPRKRTIGGDSGSPIVDADNDRLVGMLVGGNGDDHRKTPDQLKAVMIPAWHLFQPKRYQNARNSENWTLAELNTS